MTRREESSISKEQNMNIFELVEDEVGLNKPSDYCLNDIRTTHLQSKGVEDYLQSTKKSKKGRKKYRNLYLLTLHNHVLNNILETNVC